MDIKKIKILIFGVLIIVSSCQFEENVSPVNDELVNNSVLEVNELTDQYITYRTGTKNGKPDWKKILGADLMGAVGGVIAGNAAGAIIGAAGASLSAAITLNDGIPNANINKMIKNPDNEFDYYGLAHYGSVRNALKNKDNYLDNDVYSNSMFYNSALKYTVENEFLPPNTEKTFSVDDANEFVSNINDLVSTNGLTGSLNKFMENKSISPDSYSVLYPYFRALEASSSIPDFVSYSLDVESVIIKSRMSDNDKKTILSTISTARIGAQFWGLD